MEKEEISFSSDVPGCARKDLSEKGPFGLSLEC